MKITSLRAAALALVSTATLMVGSNQASAQEVSIQIGTRPPAPQAERPWPKPYSQAVWIGGHYEWVNNGWAWVGGYYTWPPKPGDKWVRARWRDGYYYPGHWRY